jgi:hypothetical protein
MGGMGLLSAGSLECVLAVIRVGVGRHDIEIPATFRTVSNTAGVEVRGPIGVPVAVGN